MMSFKNTIFILGLFIFGSVLFGQNVQTATATMTLQKAIETAMANNYDLKIAENTLEQANNSNTAGNAGLLPSVSLSGGANYSVTDSDTDMDDENGNYTVTTNNLGTTTHSATARVEYTLFDGYGNQYTFKKLKQTNLLQKTIFRQQMENTVLQVSQLYYEVCKAQQNLNLARESMQISRDRFNLTSDQKMYGQATHLDLLNAEVDMNTDSTSLLAAEQAMLTAVKDLNLMMGISIHENYWVDEKVDFREDLSAENVISYALNNNSIYLAQQQQEALSYLELKITKANKYPTVTAYGQYSYNRSDYSKGTTVNTDATIPSVGASLSFNLFNGKRQSIKTQNARLDVLNEQERTLQAKAQLERDAANSFIDYEYKRRIANLQESSLKQAKLNFEQSKEMFQLGRISSIEFRTAQQNLLNVGNKYNETLFEAKIAEFNLLKLTGELIKE